ncbi:MAG: DNA mismatch repair protein MutS [Nitrospiraceae bacterium]
MTFHSILFESIEDRINPEMLDAPEFFGDLNLDQIVDAITAGKQDYNLKPFFYSALCDSNTIQYRQVIMQDLENETLLENIKAFARNMSAVRRYLGLIEKLYFKYHKEGWFLEAANVYCDAITRLVHDLGLADLQSRGLAAFRDYLTNYAQSDCFTSLLADTKKLNAELSTVRYCLLIKGNAITVRKYDAEIDYSADVEATFEKFKQGAGKDYKAHLPTGTGMNHVEALILDCVAKLYPDIFARLDRFCAQRRNFLDEIIKVFDREIQFYVAYLEHIASLKRMGLKFCYPQVVTTSKEVYVCEGFDLALADKLLGRNSSIVCNDFYLKDPERIIVVSGPNQGGKTTFARTYGQLHYLASLGCPVPGRDARLFLFDRLFTHFEKEENIQNLRGKLQDDLFRIHQIVEQATSNSIIIMNEAFTSTTLQDAAFLGKRILEKITQRDALCVYVTFIDELASLNEKTVSMVSTVVPDNPTVRTFKIVRRPADGLAYALSIAEKYRLTDDCLKERIKA